MLHHAASPALTWSDRIHELNAWKKQRSAEIEHERQRALAALPAAAALLQAWREGLAEAADQRDDAVLQAARRQRTEELAAEAERSAGLAAAERRHREKDEITYATKEAAEREAENAYHRAFDTARGQHGISEAYIEALRAAEDARSAALAAAKKEYDAKGEDLNRLRQDAVQAALDREHQSRLAAQRACEQASKNAALDFHATKASLDRKLQDALAGVPGAGEIARRFQAQRGALEQEFRKREESIFADVRNGPIE